MFLTHDLIVASLISTLGIALLVYRAFVENDGVRSKTAIGMFIVGAAGSYLAIAHRICARLLRLGNACHPNGVTPRCLALGNADCCTNRTFGFGRVVWPLYRVHRLERLGTAISASSLSAAGFGTVAAAAVGLQERARGFGIALGVRDVRGSDLRGRALGELSCDFPAALQALDSGGVGVWCSRRRFRAVICSKVAVQAFVS
ncbi:MAG: hypothetical protein QM784_39985 [Polyangiaceae bacterium]